MLLLDRARCRKIAEIWDFFSSPQKKSFIILSELYHFSSRDSPRMETPLDVLSRAASLVHADDEKRKFCFIRIIFGIPYNVAVGWRSGVKSCTRGMILLQYLDDIVPYLGFSVNWCYFETVICALNTIGLIGPLRGQPISINIQLGILETQFGTFLWSPLLLLFMLSWTISCAM